MRAHSRFAALAAAGAIAALALTACASGAGDAGGDAAASSEVGPITEGKLTIATGEPAFAPWVIDNEPENGEGFEAAVSYAVADKLGYSKDDVVWVRSTFDAAIAPGPKDFDLNVQQFSVTPERAKAVDFTLPGVSMRNVARATWALKLGGVGYYEDMNFVHMDSRGAQARWADSFL